MMTSSPYVDAWAIAARNRRMLENVLPDRTAPSHRFTRPVDAPTAGTCLLLSATEDPVLPALVDQARQVQPRLQPSPLHTAQPLPAVRDRVDGAPREPAMPRPDVVVAQGSAHDASSASGNGSTFGATVSDATCKNPISACLACSA